MPVDRSLGCNVHLYNSNDLTEPLGGLILSNGITNENFYTMVEVFVIFRSTYVLRHEDVMDGLRGIPRDDQALQPGNYYVIAEVRRLSCIHGQAVVELYTGSIVVNDEPWLVRAASVASGFHVAAFRDDVRDRDRRRIITEQAAAVRLGHWWGFDAAHIFPLAYEEHWKQQNYGRFITILPVTTSAGSINSVQNRILLRQDIHSLFGNYAISINPDDNYKIVCFSDDEAGVAGKNLGQRFLEDPRRPVDHLLRWLFRQVVFTNMRGVGEPIFECDFPPGSDMMGEIMRSPKAGERIEFELFSRLAGD